MNVIKESNRYFCKIKYVLNQEVNEWRFSPPPAMPGIKCEEQGFAIIWEKRPLSMIINFLILLENPSFVQNADRLTSWWEFEEFLANCIYISNC